MFLRVLRGREARAAAAAAAGGTGERSRSRNARQHLRSTTVRCCSLPLVNRCVKTNTREMARVPIGGEEAAPERTARFPSAEIRNFLTGVCGFPLRAHPRHVIRPLFYRSAGKNNTHDYRNKKMIVDRVQLPAHENHRIP